jgi:hypothetical protein
MSEPTTRLIQASSNLLDYFGTRTASGKLLTAEWGEPIGHCPDSDEYIYEPIFTEHDDGKWLTDDETNATDAAMNYGAGVAAERARIRAAVEGLPGYATEHGPIDRVDRAAVLALLEPDA